MSNTFLATTAGLALTALGSVASAQDLTISIYGGGYAEDLKKTIIEPFEEKYGVTVAMESGSSSDRMAKMIATKGRGTDLMYIVDYQMADLKQRGILQPVEPGSITAMDDLEDWAKDPLGDGMCPAFTVNAVGLSYSTALETPPTSWADLMKPVDGLKTGFPDMSISYGPFVMSEVAGLNGGGIEDLDPGIAAVKDILPSLQIYTRGSQALEAIHQGEMSMAPNLNIFVSKDADAPSAFVYPEEGAIGLLNLVCVVKGSANAELAQKLIDFHLSHDIQQELLNLYGEATVRTDVETPTDANPTVIPPEQYGKLHFLDANKVYEARPALMDKWQEEVIAQ